MGYVDERLLWDKTSKNYPKCQKDKQKNCKNPVQYQKRHEELSNIYSSSNNPPQNWRFEREFDQQPLISIC